MAKFPAVARFVAPVVVVVVGAVASRSVAAAHPTRVDFQIGIELQVAAHRLLVKNASRGKKKLKNKNGLVRWRGN